MYYLATYQKSKLIPKISKILNNNGGDCKIRNLGGLKNRCPLFFWFGVP